jgi:hypothetical protein
MEAVVPAVVDRPEGGIMRTLKRTIPAVILTVAVGQPLRVDLAWAQGYGSLGGYGATRGNTDPGMGSGGTIIPYAGKFGGFMPYRMGGGGSLSFRPLPTAMMGASRPSFSLGPMSEGMSSMSGRMGQGVGARLRTLSPLGPPGGMGGGVGPLMPGMGVMPPSFGYPFRQPPSLVSPSSGAGMSM